MPLKAIYFYSVFCHFSINPLSNKWKYIRFLFFSSRLDSIFIVCQRHIRQVRARSFNIFFHMIIPKNAKYKRGKERVKWGANRLANNFPRKMDLSTSFFFLLFIGETWTIVANEKFPSFNASVSLSTFINAYCFQKFQFSSSSFNL